MIDVTLANGKVLEVEYGVTAEGVCIEEVWDAEGNEIKADELSESEANEVHKACMDHFNDPSNFPCC